MVLIAAITCQDLQKHNPITSRRYNNKRLGSRSNLGVNEIEAHSTEIGVTVLLKVQGEKRIQENMIPTLSTGKLQAR